MNFIENRICCRKRNDFFFFHSKCKNNDRIECIASVDPHNSCGYITTNVRIFAHIFFIFLLSVFFLLTVQCTLYILLFLFSISNSFNLCIPYSWMRKWMLTSWSMHSGGWRIQMCLHRRLGWPRLFHSIGNELQ